MSVFLHFHGLQEEMLHATSNSIAHMFGRLSGAEIDFDRLLRVGLPGLRLEITLGWTLAQQNDQEPSFFDGANRALNLIERTLRDFAIQARQMAEEASNEAREEELLEMAAVLEKVAVASPETMREPAQLA